MHRSRFGSSRGHQKRAQLNDGRFSSEYFSLKIHHSLSNLSNLTCVTAITVEECLAGIKVAETHAKIDWFSHGSAKVKNDGPR